ncbi:MAG: hypothetical protein ACRD8U_14440, partial [Pyrinomonadaceae bacterium]
VIEGLVTGLSQTRTHQQQATRLAAITTTPMLPMSTATGGGNQTVNLSFEFPNVRGVEDVAAVEEALSHSEVLNRILHAARAGAGRR